MKNQDILDNAPEGATHIEEETNLYIKVLPSKLSLFKDWFIFECGEWVLNDSYNILLMRSLADIQRIVELEDFKKYYADLVLSHGYDSITKLLVAHTENKKRIEEFKDQQLIVAALEMYAEIHVDLNRLKGSIGCFKSQHREEIKREIKKKEKLLSKARGCSIGAREAIPLRGRRRRFFKRCHLRCQIH